MPLVYTQSDALFDAFDFSGARTMLKAALHDAPTDGKLLWRLARATKEDAEVDGRPSAEKTAMLREGFGYAAEALKHAPNESGAHKWYCARRPPDAAEPRGL